MVSPALSLTTAAVPLAAYALLFQTLVYVGLSPRGRFLAQLTTGSIGVVVVVAGALAFGPHHLGLVPFPTRADLGPGLLAGTLAALCGLALSKSDRGRHLLADPCLGALGRGETALHLLVRIPVLTAVAEEAIFRGLLHVALLAVLPLEAAMLAGSGLFGAWHVGPALERRRSTGRSHWGVLLTVAATAVAGLFLVWLRVETGSIWASTGVHAAVNVTLAWFARRAAWRAESAQVDSLPSCTYEASSSALPAPSPVLHSASG